MFTTPSPGAAVKPVGATRAGVAWASIAELMPIGLTALMV
jgi:hypothetical protein